MNNTVLRTFTAVAMLAAAQPVLAQETIRVGAVEATRVVIAPPKSAIATTIKAGLSDAYEAAPAGSRDYRDAQRLYFFYGARHFEPLWLTASASGKVQFSPHAQKIIEAFKSADLSGLRPADYLTDAINLRLATGTPEDTARLETAFSAAALRYASDLHSGRIDPSSVSHTITELPHRLDDADLLMALTTTDDPAQFFQTLEPRHREYQALKAKLAEMKAGDAPEPVTVPAGRMLRMGMSDARVPLLRERLGVTPPFDANGQPDPQDLVYDAVLVSAVENFQSEMGLFVDGVAGPATVAALNGGEAVKRQDIIANMEMWRWLPRELGDFKVVVNIPEFRLAIMQGEDVVHETRVVVGTPRNQTPVFSDEIEHVVVNPYWNVPSSIASEEIAPILVRDPFYIANKNMELLYQGQVINAAAVDWSVTSMNNFRVRQRPGAGNALGSVKFLFPNQHNVYLHDTPSKSLFSRSVRAFSHGCVRVHNPWEFAQALLRLEPKVSIASLESQRGGAERWNNLDRKIPVHLVYLTLRVDQDGTIRSYGDVYGHMERLKQLLGED